MDCHKNNNKIKVKVQKPARIEVKYHRFKKIMAKDLKYNRVI